MSKYKNRKYKRKDVGKLSAAEQKIAELSKHKRFLQKEQREIIDSLLMWYLKNNYLTDKQWHLASNLAALGEKESKKASNRKHFYLYAMQAGDKIKVGFSSNTGKRVKSIQTGQHETVVVVWKKKIAGNWAEASRREKEIHRMLKHYHIRGEWFSIKAKDILLSADENTTVEGLIAADELDSELASNTALYL